MECIKKDDFSKAIVSHFRDRFRRWGYNDADFDNHAPNIIFFLTRTIGKEDPAAVMAEFGSAYFSLLKAVHGRNLGRKAPYQPLTYSFADFAGSRYGIRHRTELPHVHALMMVHPKYAAAVHALRLTEPVLNGSEMFDPTEKSLEELATYTMKGIITDAGVLFQQGLLWDVFPKTVPSRYRPEGRQQ